MNEAREHTLKFNAPLRAALLRAEPRVADVKGKSELFRKLEDRMKTGDAYVNQGLSAAIAVADTVVGSETCEEVFTPNSPHIALALDGVEIISNGSGSHHSLRKLDYRLELLRSATNKVGAPASASLTPAARC